MRRRRPLVAFLVLLILATAGGTTALLLQGSRPRDPALGGPHQIRRRATPPPTSRQRARARDGSAAIEIVPGREGQPPAVIYPAELTVRVSIAESGAPLARATVEVTDLWSVWSGITDARGECRFPGVEAGTVTVIASATGFQARYSIVTLAVGANPKRGFWLEKTGSISGVVRTQDGRPASSVRVVARPASSLLFWNLAYPLAPESWPNALPNFWDVTESHADGSFALNRVEAGGVYDIHAIRWDGNHSDAVRVLIPDGGALADLDLRLRMVEERETVLPTDPLPVHDGVDTVNGDALDAALGYELPLVIYSVGSGLQRQAPVPAKVDLGLAHGFVRGTVRDERGWPLPAASVRFQVPGEVRSNLGLLRAGGTDHHGRFEFPVEAGTYFVVVSGSEDGCYLPSATATATLSEGETVTFDLRVSDR